MNRRSLSTPVPTNIPKGFGGLPPREITDVYQYHHGDMIKSMKQETTELNQRFFSVNNVEIIQKLIQQAVYMKSNKKHKIGRQSDDQLLIIMKSMFLQHGRFLDTHIDEQIGELNSKVAEECAKIIIPNIEQHIHYIDNLDKNLEVMDYGESTNTAGSKTNTMFRPV